ncbi:MAG: ATP-binding protein [Desulfosarcinaceae bacterium]|nr:ATP-binding protein [Desulfosarcinaceae bacterium]
MTPIGKLNNLCVSIFCNEDATLEERRRVSLLVGLSFIGIVFLLLFGLIAFIQNNRPLFWLDLITAAILSFNLVHIHWYKNYRLNIGVGLLFVSILYIYLYTTGGTKGTAFPWYYTYPLIAAYLLGSKRGVVASTMMLIPVFLVMARQGDDGPFMNYDLNFEFRFIAAYVVVACFAYMFEAAGEKNRRELRTINRSLETIIDARTRELTVKNRQLTRENEERRKAQKALRLSEDSLTTIMDSIDATIYVADIETCEILFMNKLLKDLHGADLTGQLCWKTLRKEAGPCANCKNHRLKADLDQQAGPIISEGRHPMSGKWCVTYDRAIHWIDGRIAHLQIATDISQLKALEMQRQEMEQRLHRAQKMEAIGTLAGGVAHDLNNVLSGIVSYPELLLMELGDDSPLRGPIHTIQKSGEKASEIVQDLLTLARRGVATTQIVNLNTVICEYLAAPEHIRLASENTAITIRTDLNENLLNLEGSPIHLRKTLMNLVTNAVEAQPDGGDILISTDNRHLESPVADTKSFTPGDYVELRVVDRGMGIDPEDIHRIFEPFYTKKRMGRSGTGLGMAVVWGAVEDHNGYIRVESTPGEGTTFYLYFPATAEAVMTPEAGRPIEAYLGEGQSLLVVDDVKEQREIATKVLQRLNYTVTAVESGEAAVDYLRSNTADLVVLDMIMAPGMDGLDTYRKIIEIHPRQKVVLASGFSESERVRAAQELGASAYIRKPYSIENIGRAIKRGLANV